MRRLLMAAALFGSNGHAATTMLPGSVADTAIEAGAEASCFASDVDQCIGQWADARDDFQRTWNSTKAGPRTRNAMTVAIAAATDGGITNWPAARKAAQKAGVVFVRPAQTLMPTTDYRNSSGHYEYGCRLDTWTTTSGTHTTTQSKMTCD